MDDTQKTVVSSGIAGADLSPLPIMEANGGPVLRLLRKGAPLMPHFPAGLGEIYFSEVLPGVVKAWKKHRQQNQLFAVPWGKISIVLYDDRRESPTSGKIAGIFLGRPDEYNLLRVPAGVWYGFAAMGNSAALLCNCADMVHDPQECERLPLNNDIIPYKWLI